MHVVLGSFARSSLFVESMLSAVAECEFGYEA
jgi:hypothetical protein